MIDSELVPWGKGEKQAGKADEIVPETIRLQGLGIPAHNLLCAGRRGAYWRMSQRVTLHCLSKLYGVEAQRKRVLIARTFSRIFHEWNRIKLEYDSRNIRAHSGLIREKNAVQNRPETRRACLDQDEVPRKRNGGPNQLVVQNLWMSWDKKWKANRAWY